MLRCEVGGKKFLIGLAQGRYFAIENLCTHAYVSFGHGTLTGCKITCPWHGLKFDVHTGACESWSELDQLRRFRIEPIDGLLHLGQRLDVFEASTTTRGGET